MSWLLKGHCHEIYDPFLGQTILPEPHRNKLKGFAIFLGFASWRIKNVCLCSCWLRRLGVSIVVDYAGRCNHWLHGYGCRWLSGNNNDRCLRTQQLCPHDDRVVNDYVDIYPHSQLLLYVDRVVDDSLTRSPRIFREYLHENKNLSKTFVEAQ